MTIDVTDCPVGELLTLVSRELDCALYVDPGIDSRVTLKIAKREPEKALLRALGSVNYLITWKTERDPKGRRVDRIESISAYREGHRDDVVPVRVNMQEASAFSDAVYAGPLSDAELAELGGKLMDKSDPAGAEEAARRLASAGSSAAFRLLFDAVAVWNGDGDLTDPISRAALGITNRAVAELLLNAYWAQEDESAALAARYALAKMADAKLIESLALAYGQTRDEERREKIERLIESVFGKEAEKALIEAAGAASKMPPGFRDAALSALGNMGTATATDYLLERLEQSKKAEEVAKLSDLVRNVSASQTSVAALRYAAAGNKRISSEPARIAAIQALGRFQDPQTLALLETLTKDASAAVRHAAGVVLAGGEPDPEDDE